MGLYEKIYNVMCESEALEKSMTVGSGSFSYKAISEAAVLNAIKPLLKKHRLILIPIKVDIKEIVDSFEATKGNTTRLMTQLSTEYKIIDVDTGEFEILAAPGNGADTQDKGSGKAWTYAYKALIQKTFCLFSGEDTDNEHSDDITKRNTKLEVDTLKDEVKQISLIDLQNLVAEKGKSPDWIIKTFNANVKENEKLDDVNKLPEGAIIGLYKLLQKSK